MIYYYHFPLVGAFALTLLLACSPLQSDTPQDLLDVDRRFATIARQAGYRDAFIVFADSNAVLLHNHRPPIVGKAAIEQNYGQNAEEEFLSWTPTTADVSGDLGYTSGTYEYITLDSVGGEVEQVGFYTKIWKRQSDGEWKFVLDIGTAPDDRSVYQIHEE